MALSTKTMRGLIRYLPGARKGLATGRLVIWPETTAPVYGNHARPTSAPSGTGAKGDWYINSSDGLLYVHDGTAFRAQLNAANDITLAASKTLAITTADKLTVGGVIVPATLYWNFKLHPAETVTEYDLAVIKRAIQVVSIDVVPSTLQGGALTATIVKASGTSAPDKGTTPLHTADAINLNTGAYTNQSITLTATTADLQFAAGTRLGVDFSAAYDTGHAAVTIGYKYI